MYESERLELEKLNSDENSLKGGFDVVKCNEECKKVNKVANEKKRKRERLIKEKENVRKDVYKVKYIGETGRSGYERGIEHSTDFERLEDRSHMLRHYIMKHTDIKLDDLEFGMRIRNSFKTALDRQVGEAVAISREKRAGTDLLNSKAEYNRCKIERLDTRSEKIKLKEISKENEVESRLKEIIKKMRNKKRERSKENRKRTKEIKAALIEIQNENISKWKKRRKMQVEVKRVEDDEGVLSLERLKRKNLAEHKKKEIMKDLRSKEKKLSWLNEKKGHWRNYRESLQNDDVTSDEKYSKLVKGNSENVVEKCMNSIAKVGQKVEFKLRETVFKKSFSDLKKSDYLRLEVPTVCPSCKVLLQSKLSKYCLSCLETDPIDKPAIKNPISSDLPAQSISVSGWVDDELDLLRIMSTWPGLIGTNNQLTVNVSSVVKNDLSGPNSKIQVSQSSAVKYFDNSQDSFKFVNHYYSNIELIKVTCYVDENYVSNTDLKVKLRSLMVNQCHLVDNFKNSASTKPKRPLNRTSPTKKIKPKSKKITPKKPLKLREFLEKIKSKKKSSPNLPNYEGNLPLNTPTINNTPSESIAQTEANEHQENAKFNVNSVELEMLGDCVVENPEDLLQNRPKTPVKYQPNRSDFDVNVLKNPGRFGDLRSFLNLSNSLVGRSNFYKVAEPSVSSKVLTKKKKYKFVKKEAELVRDSSNSIRKYFPSKVNSNVCSTGKRKLSMDSIQDSTEVLKKQKVGEQTIG